MTDDLEILGDEKVTNLTIASSFTFHTTPKYYFHN